MRKLFLVVAALGVLAVVYTTVHLDAYLNENRAWLEAQAELLLERPVEIGYVGVEWGPGVGVRIDGFSIAEDPAFGAEPMLQARSVAVGLRAWPALFGRYEITHVDIDSPRIRVLRSDEGLSIATLGGTAAGKEPEARQDAARVLEDEQGADLGVEIAARIALGLANIEDGTLRFIDRTRQPPLELVVGRLHAVASELELDQPLAIQIRAELLEATGLPPDVAFDGPIVAKLRMTGTITAPTLHLAFDGSSATLLQGDHFVKPAGTPLGLSVRMQYQGTNMARLEQGELQLGPAVAAFRGTAQLEAPFALDLELTSQSVPMSGWDRIFPAVADVTLSGEADLAVRVLDNADPETQSTTTGTLTLRDVGALVEGMPAVTGLSAIVELDGRGASIEKSPLEIGGSEVDLALRIDDWTHSRVTFEATAETLRAASLALDAPDAEQPEILQGLVLTGNAALSALGATADVSLMSSKGSLRDIGYRELSADIRYRDAVTTLESGSLRALGGDIQLSGHYDTRDAAAPPAFAFEVMTRSVRLEEYLAVRFPTDSPVIEGRLSGELRLTGSGSEWDVIKRALTGNGTIELEQGVLYGVNLAQGVLSGIASVPLVGPLVSSPLKAAYPIALGEPNTRFDRMAAKLEVDDGRITTPELLLSAKDYSLEAEGELSLDGDVAMKAIFIAGNSLTQDLVGRLNPLRRLTGREGQLQIPFTLTGPATELKVRPDVNHVSRSLTTGLMTDAFRQLSGGTAEGKPTESSNATSP